MSWADNTRVGDDVEHLGLPAWLWESNHPTNGKLVEPSEASNCTPGDFLKRNEHCVYQRPV